MPRCDGRGAARGGPQAGERPAPRGRQDSCGGAAAAAEQRQLCRSRAGRPPPAIPAAASVNACLMFASRCAQRCLLRASDYTSMANTRAVPAAGHDTAAASLSHHCFL